MIREDEDEDEEWPPASRRPLIKVLKPEEQLLTTTSVSKHTIKWSCSVRRAESGLHSVHRRACSVAIETVTVGEAEELTTPRFVVTRVGPVKSWRRFAEGSGGGGGGGQEAPAEPQLLPGQQHVHFLTFLQALVV